MNKIEIFKNLNKSKKDAKKLLVKILKLNSEKQLVSINVKSINQTDTSCIIKLTVSFYIRKISYVENLFIKGPSDNKKMYLRNSLKEIEFYQNINIYNASIPIIKHFYSYVSDNKDDFLLVLEDISNQYKTIGETNRSKIDYWYGCIETLARVHAYFWNYKNINEKLIDVRNKSQLKETELKDLSMLEKFFCKYKEELSDKEKSFLKKAMYINIDFVKEVRERTIKKDRITIVHGDSHIHNFMFSINEDKNTILFDYQFFNKGIGTIDLAHLFRVDFPESLLVKQLDLVSYYHKILIENDVKDYSKKDCLRDFRNSVGVMMLIPFWQINIFNKPFDEVKLSLEKRISNFELVDSIINQ